VEASQFGSFKIQVYSRAMVALNYNNRRVGELARMASIACSRFQLTNQAG
jgi:hypothetical protein